MEDDNDEEDVFSDPLSNDPKASQASAMLKKHRRENTEHSNPNSYSWIIMRLAIMKLAQSQLQEFINIAGIEMQGEGDTVYIIERLDRMFDIETTKIISFRVARS